MQVRSGLAPLRSTHIFWIAILLLAAVSAVAVLSTYRLMEQYAASMRSQQAIQELNGFLSDLKDVETSARGYALTHDPAFLEPYRSGTVQLRQRIERLHTLARSEDQLAGRLARLEAAARRRVAATDNLISLASRGAGQPDLVAAVGAGKAAMDEVRREVGSTVAAEQVIHLRRQAMLERQAVTASIALGLGVASSLVVLVWLFGRSNREVVRRRAAEGDLRRLNLELEDRVQERTAEVNRARDLLNAVVENLPDMVLLKEPSGDGFRYLLVNAAAEQLLGRDRDEILGKTERDLFPPEEADMVVQTNKAVAKSGRPRTFTDRKMTTLTGIRTVETRMVPIVNGNGSLALMLAIIRDVTDARARDEQLRLLQRMDAIGRLTGGVAHDFNNLLAIIAGNTELLRKELDDGTEGAEMAEDVIGAAVRGAELVRRLLAFARKQHLEPTAVDLNERLPHVVPLLQRTLGENISMQVNSATDLWDARIDPSQVDDALVNLAVNARDAMPNGGMLTIETANVILDEDYASHHAEVMPGEYVMLAVSDTGSGMPPEVIDRAFDPFFTTKPEGRGTGLGLSQVFGWVKQSGGHIKIYSEEGHGTTIKLYLPRATPEDARPQMPQFHEPEMGGHETVLVVEDNPNVLRTLKRQLADLGYATIEAEDGVTARELIASGVEFDLLLTDVVMPGGMSGYELAAEAEKLRPGMKVLFTSGYTELAATGLQTARKGPLISKPYTKRDLGRAIRSVLDDQGTPIGQRGD